jgi:ABC-type sugar transport system permease subunit
MFSLRAFGSIYALYPTGGPGQVGRVLGIFLYENFQISWEVGASVCLSYVIMFLAFVISLPLTVGMYRGMEG